MWCTDTVDGHVVLCFDEFWFFLSNLVPRGQVEDGVDDDHQDNGNCCEEYIGELAFHTVEVTTEIKRYEVNDETYEKGKI